MTASRPGSRASAARLDRWLQLVNIVVSLAIAAFLVIFVADQRDQLECQARTNAAFRDALAERVAASGADRAALRQLLTEVVGSDRPDEQLRGALDAYLRAADEIATRTPQLPNLDQTCQS